MRKGSLSLLLALGVTAFGAAAYAASPVLSPLPVIVISDEENNGSVDNNLFVYTAAFVFGDYVVDADTTDNQLLWSFIAATGGGNVGTIEINGVGPLAAAGDAATPGANTISFSGVTYLPSADFRETTLSPTAGSAPFADPGTPISSNTDVNGDGYDDDLVGDLAVTFFVVDDQATLAAVASDSTFVYTIDTDPTAVTAPDPAFGAGPGTPFKVGGLGDTILPGGVPAMTFTNLGFIDVSDPNAIGADDWQYLSWDDVAAGVPWLWSNLGPEREGASSPYSALNQTGSQTEDGQTNRPDVIFSSSFGTWQNRGAVASQYVAGNLYGVRATLGWAVGAGNTASNQIKNLGDTWRIFSRETTLGSVLMQTDISGARQVATTGSPINNPFIAAAGSTQSYLMLANHLDADIVRPNTLSNPNLFFFVGYDFVNFVAGGNFLQARLTGFEIGAAARASYEANASPLNVFGNGGGEQTFDGSGTPHVASWAGWGVEQTLQITGPGASGTLLSPFLASEIDITAGAVVLNVPARTNLPYIITSNHAGNSEDLTAQDALLDANSIDALVVDAAYRANFEITNAPTATRRPQLQIEVRDPDIQQWFEKREIVPEQSGVTTAAYTSGSSQTFSIFFVNVPRFQASDNLTGIRPGVEDDLQANFGTVENQNAASTASLTKFRLHLLGADDPNVNY